MKNDKVPEIRFNGFGGEWEERKLESLTERVKSYSLSRDVESREYTGYKYIHYGDIHTKVANIIDENSILPNIKEGAYELLEKGDLILADASEDYQGIATPAIVNTYTPYKLVAGLHTIALRPLNSSSLFLYYLCNSSSFKKYGFKTGTGMKVFGISFSNLVKFEGNIPSLEEQTQIGCFFKKLDSIIAIRQRELDNVRQTKKAFLQKMFPQEEETVPEIRFPWFSSKWEERKLGNTNTFFTDGNYGESYPSKNDMSDFANGVPFLRGNNLSNGYLHVVNANYITKEKHFTLASGHLKIDDIVIAVRGSLGALGYVNKENVDWNINSQLAIIRTDKTELQGRFLIQYLLSHKGQKELLSRNTGTALKQLPISQLKDVQIPLPQIEEQIQIGNFFQQLDATIALHQRELDLLKETKKAFLQKMYV